MVALGLLLYFQPSCEVYNPFLNIEVLLKIDASNKSEEIITKESTDLFFNGHPNKNEQKC
jgi:hypothetical protein